MEQIQETQNSTLFISELTSEKRVAFYKKTYTHLALSVLLFVLVEMVFTEDRHRLHDIYFKIKISVEIALTCDRIRRLLDHTKI